MLFSLNIEMKRHLKWFCRTNAFTQISNASCNIVECSVRAHILISLYRERSIIAVAYIKLYANTKAFENFAARTDIIMILHSVHLVLRNNITIYCGLSFILSSAFNALSILRRIDLKALQILGKRFRV